jgi:hypothetical protein
MSRYRVFLFFEDNTSRVITGFCCPGYAENYAERMIGKFHLGKKLIIRAEVVNAEGHILSIKGRAA